MHVSNNLDRTHPVRNPHVLLAPQSNHAINHLDENVFAWSGRGNVYIDRCMASHSTAGVGLFPSLQTEKTYSLDIQVWDAADPRTIFNLLGFRFEAVAEDRSLHEAPVPGRLIPCYTRLRFSGLFIQEPYRFRFLQPPTSERIPRNQLVPPAQSDSLPFSPQTDEDCDGRELVGAGVGNNLDIFALQLPRIPGILRSW